MGIYDDLGVPRVINAQATLTRLGGSRMPDEVVAAMEDAAGAFVDLVEFQNRVCEEIARLTNNEAAWITSGAAAGITQSVAACIAGNDPALIDGFPYLEHGGKSEVIVFRSQRNGYDYAARQTGARLIEIGTDESELAAAISPRTSSILWFAGSHYADGALPIEEVVDIARARGVPVIVDAAAQIPPISSLWHFTRDVGVDIAIFSGGKGLRGPQSSGLVLGRKELVDACRVNASPNSSIGRPMKVGKEETAGLLAAVKWSLAQDEPALLEQYERSVRYWIEGLSGLPGITAERIYPSEAGQPHGRALLTMDPERRDQTVAVLWNRNPRIAVAPVGTDGIALNPQTLEPGEDEIVLQALLETLGA